jgi:hypothetical protein
VDLSGVRGWLRSDAGIGVSDRGGVSRMQSESGQSGFGMSEAGIGAPGLFETRVCDLVRQASLKLQELVNALCESERLPEPALGREGDANQTTGIFCDPVLFEMAPDGYLLLGSAARMEDSTTRFQGDGGGSLYRPSAAE